MTSHEKGLYNIYVAGTMPSALIKGGVLIIFEGRICSIFYVALTANGIMIKGAGPLLNFDMCISSYSS